MKEEKRDFVVDIFTRNRQLITESISASKYFNHVIGITDADITDALKIIKNYKEKTGEQLSLTAWVMRCVAKAASEFPEIRTFRWKKWKTVIFNDVDIKCMIERVIANRRVPIHYIFRKADKKSFQELHEELRFVQQQLYEQREGEKRIKKRQQQIMRLPIGFRKRFIWPKVITNPFKHKEHLGILGISAVGMFGKGMTGWVIPKTMHQTQLTIGAVVRKPVETKEGIAFRDFLNLSLTLNHDIIDGGPAVEFMKRIVELLNDSFELERFKI